MPRPAEPAPPAVLAGDTVMLVEPDNVLFARLLPVARRIFTDTFSPRYEPAAFAAYCDDVYAPGGSMAEAFSAPDIAWCVATAGGDPIGYAKLTPLRAQVEGAAADAMEMQQLYVLQTWHGTGVADRLVAWVLRTARAKGATELYLTVFDHNERARRFYTRHGFVESGRCTFRLGDRVDEDGVWRRRLD